MNILKFVRKISPHLLTLSLLAVPFLVHGADPDPQGFIICGNPDQTPCEFKDFFPLANLIIDRLIFMIAIPLATLAIMIGGIMYAMYPINPGKKAQAWSIIKAALIGIVIALVSYALVKAVISLMTNSSVLDLNSLF